MLSNKKFLTILVTFGVGLLFSLSFVFTPLYGDEVFVIFLGGQQVFEGPGRIPFDSLRQSADGWSSGRFVAPWLHSVANLGLVFNYGIAEFTSLNLLQAYALARGLLFAAVIVGTTFFVLIIVKGRIKSRAMSALAIFVAPAILATMVTNHGYSSIRMNPWVYSATLLFLIILFSLIAQTVKRIASGSISERRAAVVLGTIGFFLGSTYELTQLFGPVALLLYVLMISLYGDGSRRPLGALQQSLGSKSFWALFVGWALPFVIIRANGYFVCAEKGCYSPSTINPTGISLETVASRFLSGSPIAAMHHAVQENPSLQVLDFTLSGLFFILVLLVGVVITLLLNRRGLHLDDSVTKPSLVSSGLALFAFGFAGSLSLAVGIASSVNSQNMDPLAIGESYTDTLPNAVFHSLMYSGLGIALLGQVKSFSRRAVAPAFIGLVLSASLLATASFIVNSATTQNLHNSPEFAIQTRFALELGSPNLTAEGDDIRCDLVKFKLATLPEWEGHDRFLVNGLNKKFLSDTSLPFCSLDESVLFENYEPGLLWR